jgi:hypothetical protein
VSTYEIGYTVVVRVVYGLGYLLADTYVAISSSGVVETPHSVSGVSPGVLSAIAAEVHGAAANNVSVLSLVRVYITMMGGVAPAFYYFFYCFLGGLGGINHMIFPLPGTQFVLPGAEFRFGVTVPHYQSE